MDNRNNTKNWKGKEVLRIMRIIFLIFICLSVCAYAVHLKAHLGNSEPEVSILTPRDAAHPEDIVNHNLNLKKKKLLIPRSIAHDHPDGGNRTCEYEKDLIAFLPPNYSAEHSGGHYHLLLAVSDDQLPFLINWLALVFELGYLPSHRVLMHFTCEGPAAKNFVEKHLLSECMKAPERVHGSEESLWRLTIKNRLATFLDIVDALDETDWGAMTFDVDAPWIRNMLPVFDYYSHSSKHNYDLITQGVMIDRKDAKHDGKVLVNFGGVFLKNSPAGKALSKRTRALLNDPKLEFDWPDQDYLTYALLDLSKATQEPLPMLKHLSKDSNYHNEHCVEHPDTCTHVSTGVHGSFTVPPLAPASAPIPGTYMFLPGIIAPDKCEHICSGATVLFQHCGLAACLDETNNHHCHDIPEFVLKSHEVHKILVFDPPRPGFTPAVHGTFDSKTLQYQAATLKKFVSTHRLMHFCRAYSSVCNMDEKSSAIILL